ncbi:MAG TPA: hypothetical protein VGM88_04875 [Kofleriaceae bacterium]|jgi:hypothetical protein
MFVKRSALLVACACAHPAVRQDPPPPAPELITAREIPAPAPEPPAIVRALPSTAGIVAPPGLPPLPRAPLSALPLPPLPREAPPAPELGGVFYRIAATSHVDASTQWTTARVYRVQPEDWAAVAAGKTRGTVVIDRADTRHGFDLPPGTGHYLIDYADRERHSLLWIERTNLAIDAHVDGARAIVSARPGMALQLGGDTAIADEHGLATLPWHAHAPLVGRWERDSIILAPTAPEPPQPRLAWLVAANEPRRAGDYVAMSGLVRERAPHGQPAVPNGGVFAIDWEVRTRAARIGHGTAPLWPNGAFDLTVPTARGAWLVLTTVGPIVERVEVSLAREPPRLLSVDEIPGEITASTARVTGDAAVDFTLALHGPHPDAALVWRWHASPLAFAPAAWRDFHFFSPGAELDEATLRGTLDGDRAAMRAQIRAAATPMTVAMQATVLSGKKGHGVFRDAKVAAFPADVALGLHLPHAIAMRGEPLVIEAITVDLDGTPVVGRPIEIDAGAAHCALVSAAEPVSCALPLHAHAVVRGRVTDAQGRAAVTEVAAYTESTPFADTPQPPANRGLSLVADRDHYAPGDTAYLLVAAAAPGHGVLQTRRDGILTSEPLAIDGASKVVAVPITGDMTPSASVTATIGSQTAALELAIDRPPPLDVVVTPHGTSAMVQVMNRGAPAANADVLVTIEDAAASRVEPAPAELLAPAAHEGSADTFSVDRRERSAADALDAFGSWYMTQAGDDTQQYIVEGINTSGPSSRMPPTAAARPTVAAAAEITARPAAARPAAARATVAAAAEVAARATVAAAAEIAARATVAAAAEVAARDDVAPTVSFHVHTAGDGSARVPLVLSGATATYRVRAVAATDIAFGAGEARVAVDGAPWLHASGPTDAPAGGAFAVAATVTNPTTAPLTVRLAASADGATLAAEPREVVLPPNAHAELAWHATAAKPGIAAIQIVAVAGTHATSSTVRVAVSRGDALPGKAPLDRLAPAFAALLRDPNAAAARLYAIARLGDAAARLDDIPSADDPRLEPLALATDGDPFTVAFTLDAALAARRRGIDIDVAPIVHALREAHPADPAARAYVLVELAAAGDDVDAQLDAAIVEALQPGADVVALALLLRATPGGPRHLPLVGALERALLVRGDRATGPTPRATALALDAILTSERSHWLVRPLLAGVLAGRRGDRIDDAFAIGALALHAQTHEP